VPPQVQNDHGAQSAPAPGETDCTGYSQSLPLLGPISSPASATSSSSTSAQACALGPTIVVAEALSQGPMSTCTSLPPAAASGWYGKTSACATAKSVSEWRTST